MSYGPPEVLRCTTVATPTPGYGEILVAVASAAVTTVDCVFRRGNQLAARSFTGLLRPSRPVLGGQFSGEVVAVGEGVSRFAEGNAVMGSTGGFGAHAEFVCVRQDAVIAPKPGHISHGEAAAFVEGALTALPFLRDTGGLQEGYRVLVNGASGSVGSAAVQIAHCLGARVTAVASTKNHEWLLALGAEETIDYSLTDFALGGKLYDIVFDAVGRSSFSHARRALKPGGVYLSTVLGAGIVVQMLRTSLGKGPKARFAATGMRPEEEQSRDLAFLVNLLDAGRLSARVDRIFSLHDIVEAHRYVETGHKKGNVLVEP